MTVQSITLSERARNEESHTVWFHLFKMSRIGKSVDIESILAVVQGWGRGGGWGVIADGCGGFAG